MASTTVIVLTVGLLACFAAGQTDQMQSMQQPSMQQPSMQQPSMQQPSMQQPSSMQGSQSSQSGQTSQARPNYVNQQSQTTYYPTQQSSSRETVIVHQSQSNYPQNNYQSSNTLTTTNYNSGRSCNLPVNGARLPPEVDPLGCSRPGGLPPPHVDLTSDCKIYDGARLPRYFDPYRCTRPGGVTDRNDPSYPWCSVTFQGTTIPIGMPRLAIANTVRFCDNVDYNLFGDGVVTQNIGLTRYAITPP